MDFCKRVSFIYFLFLPVCMIRVLFFSFLFKDVILNYQRKESVKVDKKRILIYSYITNEPLGGSSYKIIRLESFNRKALL